MKLLRRHSKEIAATVAVLFVFGPAFADLTHLSQRVAGLRDSVGDEISPLAAWTSSVYQNDLKLSLSSVSLGPNLLTVSPISVSDLALSQVSQAEAENLESPVPQQPPTPEITQPAASNVTIVQTIRPTQAELERSLLNLLARGLPQDILATLQGPQGPMGPQGPQGPAGPVSSPVSYVIPTASTGGQGSLFGATYLSAQELTTSKLLVSSDLTQTGGNTALRNTSITGSLSVTDQVLGRYAPRLAHQLTNWPDGLANLSDASLVINPATAIADGNLIAAGVNGEAKFIVDAEGDVFARNLTLSGLLSMPNGKLDLKLLNLAASSEPADPTDGLVYFDASAGKFRCYQSGWRDCISTSSSGTGLADGLAGETLRFDGTSWSPSSLLYNNGTNIGINTKTPQYRLDIAGALRLQASAVPTGANGVMYYDSTLNSFRCYQNGSWSDCGSMPSGSIGQTIRFDGTKWVGNNVLFNDGTSVSIGTTNPEEKLDVAGNLQVRRSADASSGSTVKNSNYLQLQGAYWNGSSSVNLYWRLQNQIISTTPPRSRLAILDPTNLETLVIRDDGRMGLGVASPNYRLDVAGAVNASNGFCMNGDCRTAWPAALPSASAGQTLVYDSGSWVGSSTLYASGGAVGINTTSPSGALDVNGNGRIYNRNNFGSTLFVVRAGQDQGLGNLTQWQNYEGGVLSVMDRQGWLGIGTTNPGYGVDVANGSINAQSLCIGGVCHSAWAEVPSGTAGQTLRHDGTNWLADSLLYNNGTNIGINNTSPSAKLDITGDLKVKGNQLVAGGLGSSTVTVQAGSGQSSSPLLRWQDSSGNSLGVISAAGNLGIGTTAPAYGVDIASALRLQPTTVPTGANGVIYFDSTSNTFKCYQNGAFTDCVGGGGVLPSGTAGQTLRSDGTDWLASSLLYNSGSRVGINTANPQNTLDVAGGVAIGGYAGVRTAPSNGLVVSGQVGIGTYSPTSTLDVNGSQLLFDQGDNGTTGLTIRAGTGQRTRMLVWQNNAGDEMGYITYDGNLVVSTTRIGVGKATPDYPIDVAGSINVSGGFCIAGACRTSWISDMPAGTAAGETVYFDGTNWSSSANLYNNGTSVGIGTSSPAAKLDVNGDFRVAGNTVSTATIKAGSNQGVNPLLSWQGSDGTALGVINASGKLGIGTASPSYSLDIAGALRLQASAAPTGANGVMYFDSTSGTFKCYLNDAWTDCVGGGGVLPSGTSGQTLRHDGSLWSASSFLYNTGSRIGVNTANPQNTLDVAGGVAIGDYAGVRAAPSNGLIVAGQVGVGTYSPSSTLDVNGNARIYNRQEYSSTTLTIRAGSTQAKTALIRWEDSAGNLLGSVDYAGRLVFGTAEAGNSLDIQGTAQLRGSAGTTGLVVDGSGNVGVQIVPNSSFDLNGVMNLRGVSSAAAAPAGQARIYFDSVSKKLRASEDNGIYLDLIPQGGAASVFVVGGNTFGAIASIGTNDDFDLAFKTNGTEKARISSLGYLGVNETNPSYHIDVKGPIRLQPIAAPAIPTNGLMYYDSGLNKFRCYQNNGWLDCVTDAAAASGWTRTGSIVALSTITDKVGVGVADPGVYKLSVSGNANVTGTLNVSGALSSSNVSGTNTGDQTITLTGDVTGSGTGSFSATIANSAVTSAKIADGTIVFGDWASNSCSNNQVPQFNGSAWVCGTIAAGSSQWTTSSSDIYYNSGNVGIGTSSPAFNLVVSSDTYSILGLNTFSSASADVNRSVLVLQRARGTAASMASVNDGDLIGTIQGNAYTGYAASFYEAARIGFEVDGAVTAQKSAPGRITFGTALANSSVTEKMRITSDGNVGIGTTTPGAKLEVNGSIKITAGSGGQLIFSNGSGMSTAAATATGMTSITDLSFAADTDANGSGVLNFSTHSINRMTIANNGNVGIGTSSPSYLLHIVGSGGRMVFESNSDSQSNIEIWRSRGAVGGKTPVATGDTLGNLVFRGFDGSGDLSAAGISAVVNGAVGTNNVPTDMKFLTNPGAASWTEKMRLTALGDLGIGTTTPTAKLEVNGSIKITAGSGGQLIFADGSGMSTAAATATGMASTADLSFAADTDTNGSGILNFATHGSNRITVDNSGNVGIGTTSPAAKLDVNGNVRVAGNIMPEMTGATGTLSTRTIGDTNNRFSDVWANEVHVGASSLYVNGKKVISDVSDVMNFTTDLDQSMLVKAQGTGNVNVQTDQGTVWLKSNQALQANAKGGITFTVPSDIAAQNLNFTNNSASGSITFNATGSASQVQFSAVSSLSFTAPTATLSGSLGWGGGAAIASSSNLISLTGCSSNQVPQWNGSAWACASVTGSSQWTTSGSNIYYTTGSVGIGTTTPSANLHVYSSTNGSLRVEGGNGQGGIQIVSSGTNDPFINFGNAGTVGNGGAIYTRSGNLMFRTGDKTDKLTIQNSTGNVGIGTTSPSALLQVQGTNDSTVRIQNTSPTGYSNLEFYNDTGVRKGYVATGGSSTQAVYANNMYMGTPVGAGNSLLFTTEDTERMRITSTGRFGIGTSNPATKLEITGAEDTPQNASIMNTRPNYPALIFNATSGGTNAKLWRLIGRSGNDFEIQTLDDSWGGETTAFQINRSGTAISNVLFPNGNVGMGTSTIDSGYLLQLPNNSSRKAKANAWDTYSDARVKTEQQSLNYGLKEILALQPKRYFQNDSLFENGVLKLSAGGRYTVGLVAQDVYMVVPEAVNKPFNENGELWAMDYTKLIPVIINGIQELNRQDSGRYGGNNLEVGLVVRFNFADPWQVTVLASADQVNPVGVVKYIDKDGLAEIGFSGRMKVKVTSENGAVKAGDYLVLSRTTPGYGAKMTETGSALGLALADATDGLDEVEAYVNFAYQRVSVASAPNGQLTTLEGDLDAAGFTLLNVKSIASISGKWSIDDTGLITARKVKADVLETVQGITVKDRATGEWYCVFIENGAMKQEPGACDQQQAASQPIEQQAVEASTDTLAPAEGAAADATTADPATLPVPETVDSGTVSGTETAVTP